MSRDCLAWRSSQAHIYTAAIRSRGAQREALAACLDGTAVGRRRQLVPLAVGIPPADDLVDEAQ